jgi:hypothetical protein
MPETEFYQWIGVCIKAWAAVENKLFDVCELVLAADRKRAAIVFYRTPTIDTRLSLTSELVLTVLPQRERKDGGHDHPDVFYWKDLVKDIRDLLPIRNLLAHAPIAHAHETEFLDAEGKETMQTSWYEIMTSLEEQLTGKHELVIQDIELPEYLKKVRGIGQDLTHFYYRLLAKGYAKPVPPEEYVPRKAPRKPSRSRASTRSHRAKSRRRPGSSRA